MSGVELLDPIAESSGEPSQTSAHSDVTLEQATATYAQGDWEKAAEEFQSVLNESTAKDVLRPLGLSYYRLEKYELGASCFEQLISKEFDDDSVAHAYVDLANCQLRLENFETAEENYRKAAELKSNGFGEYGMACLCSLQQHCQDSLNWLELAVQKNAALKQTAIDDTDLEAIWPYVRFGGLTDTPEESEDEWIIATTRKVVKALRGPAKMLGLVKSYMPVPYPMSLHRWCIKRVFNNRRKLHGLEVVLSAWASKPGTDDADLIQQLDEALQLIQRVWPKVYQEIQQDLEVFSIERMPAGGQFVSAPFRTCKIARSNFADDWKSLDENDKRTRVIALASIIVHEACHARVFAWGCSDAQGSRKDRFREERLCRKQQTRFLLRAKSDAIYPVDPNRDVGYENRFGMWEGWYYAYNEKQTFDERVEDQLQAFESDEVFAWKKFIQHVFANAEHYGEYVEDLLGALKPDSKDAGAWHCRGLRYVEIQRYEEAIHDLQRSVELEDCEYTWLTLGRAAMYSGQDDLAISSFERALEKGVQADHGLVFLVPLAVQSASVNCRNASVKRRKAIEWADQLAAEFPRQHRMLLYQAWARSTSKKHLPEAAKLVDQALEYHPECLWASLVGQFVYTKLGKSERASACWQNYQENLRLWPDKELAEPESTRAVVLRAKRFEASYAATVLFSVEDNPEGMQALALSQLAERLLNQTSQPASNATEDYLHAFVRKRFSHTSDAKPLPVSIANRDDLWIARIKVPFQYLDGANDNECQAIRPLDKLPIVFDRQDPAVVAVAE